MREFEELRDNLCSELKEYNRQGKISLESLHEIDKLAHAIKNIDKILESEEGYSGRMYYDGGMSGRGSYRGGSYDGGSYDGGSYGNYGRGGYSSRRGRGRNAKRDSMGRYARANDMMVDELRDLMDSAPDEQTRMEFERFINKMEQM